MFATTLRKTDLEQDLERTSDNLAQLTITVCAENVPVPEQLRNPAGIKQLKGILKDKFAKSRELQLHCIKLACRWPDHRSPYADLLGWLTTLGDIEALGYQWQGQKDKSHNADRLLKQASCFGLLTT